jgi:protein MPE1
VPQLQAQVQQLALMLQNPALPKHVRQQTEMQHQQLQMQLQHAQTIAVALAMSNAQAAQAGTQAFVQAGPTIAMGMPAASVFPNGMNMTGVPPGQGFPSVGGWSGQYTPQAAPQDSPYQRLPVNNRRRNLKRERPSDFVEVAGVDSSAKQPRYWE